MIDRVGFDKIQDELLNGDILERKEEILNAELHITGGATC